MCVWFNVKVVILVLRVLMIEIGSCVVCLCKYDVRFLVIMWLVL